MFLKNYKLYIGTKVSFRHKWVKINIISNTMKIFKYISVCPITTSYIVRWADVVFCTLCVGVFMVSNFYWRLFEEKYEDRSAFIYIYMLYAQTEISLRFCVVSINKVNRASAIFLLPKILNCVIQNNWCVDCLWFSM